MLDILTGFCVIAESVRAVLIICPPPSPYEPSISIMGTFPGFAYVKVPSNFPRISLKI
jgi:hypothetical protein